MPEIIYVPPARENILYAVMEKPRGDNAICEVFTCIVEKLTIRHTRNIEDFTNAVKLHSSRTT